MFTYTDEIPQIAAHKSVGADIKRFLGPRQHDQETTLNDAWMFVPLRLINQIIQIDQSRVQHLAEIKDSKKQF